MIDPQKPDFTNTPIAPTRPSFGYAPVDGLIEPYITVITAFFNTDAVFHETAQSVFQQSFQQWEWLIVNDASTDPGALAVLAEYRERDPRVRVIDLPENIGAGAARNAGVRAARGQYIAMVDSDDLIEPTTLEQWIWCLESYPEYAFVKGYSVGFGALDYLWPKGFQGPKAFLLENNADLTSMIRKPVFEQVGGYDQTIRHGFEDWEFWLRCANAGYWGNTIPEFLDWYRRRTSHADRWSNWDLGKRQQRFRAEMEQRYPKLWQSGFPTIQIRHQKSYDAVPNELPFQNPLSKQRRRVLMILPWLTLGGADKFNLDLLKLLVEQHQYQVTIATTLEGDHSWMPIFSNSTPDIFVLHHFLRLVDYPRFLRYLIESRQIDVVLISNSYLGYFLLPYLRAHCPNTTFMDYIHMEEEYWKNGGYPQASLNHAEQLDLTVVSSQHLKDWMRQRGGDPCRIEVCTTNIDTDDWSPDRYDRAALRGALGTADAPIILYAGRICQQKQPQVFANVMLKLAQRHQFVCLVAGDGPDRAWLERFIRSNRLSCVRMLGSVNNQRMRELMATSDIFFLPSEMEGISLAIYEAMAMGAVPVSAAVGGQAELVTPECGILVSRNEHEIDAYVAGLSRLLADPQLRTAMGCAARQRVQEHYRLEHMGQRMVRLMAQAAELGRVSPRPTVPLGLGLETAIQAIEQVRLEQVTERLWRERQALLAGKPTRDTIGRYVVLKVMRRTKLILRPIYRWAIGTTMAKWLVPLRERLSLTLVRWVH
jgi:glycosyltransferase involved in cell wall biosynthesis